MQKGRFVLSRFTDAVRYRDYLVNRQMSQRRFSIPATSTRAVWMLSNLLTRHPTCHPRLVDVLWRVILKPGVEISTSLKSELLSALTRRLEKITTTRLTRMEPAFLDGRDPGVTALCDTITDTIFYRSSISCRQPLQQWSLSHTFAIFASDAPVETRWNNLRLLALFNALPELSNGDNKTLAQNLSHSPTSDWGTVCTLATLEISMALLRTPPTEGIEDITQTLWHAWSGASRDTHKSPAFVTRAIVASFFRLGAESRNIPLRDACYRYSTANFLWSEEGEKKMLAVEYVAACVACGEKNWHRIFSTLDEAFSGTTWQSETANVLISHFILRDLVIAYQLSLFCSQNSIDVSGDLLHTLSMSLVFRDHVDLAIRFLQDRRFSPSQMRELLGAILSSRNRCIDPKHVAPVCDAMHALYTSSDAPYPPRWGIERILLLAVTSGHSFKAIAVVQTIQQNSQPYLTPKFYFRLLRELVARRQFRYAMRLLDLVAKAHASHVKAFRRVLTFGLTKGGASALARRANAYQIGRSTKESLARALYFRPKCPSRVLALRILPMLRHTTSDLPSIQYALHVLIRANRILAAKKLFERTQSKLDTKARTSLGNIVLHGALLRPSRRNGRRTRKVLSVLDHLVKDYSFVPDRITVNILLKSLLRWTRGIDAEKIKTLFDHMIRSGYPAGRLAEAPFNTPLSSGNVQLPNLPPFISFERHARPMYRMFIKAFHLRGDVQSARVVIGILKDEEKAMLERREIRSRARQAGRARARKVSATVLGGLRGEKKCLPLRYV